MGHLGESYFNLIQNSEKDNQKWLSFLYAMKEEIDFSAFARYGYSSMTNTNRFSIAIPVIASSASS